MHEYNTIEALAILFVNKKLTLRSLSSVTGIPRTSLHYCFRKQLPKVNPELYTKVDRLLLLNKAEKHIRGGRATANRFKSAKAAPQI